jgi:alkylation response protein AidB-like acyl-CoA dehydrogenase
MIVVLRGLGHHTTPGPFLPSAVLAVTALSGARDNTVRRRWLPRLASGEAVAAVAVAGAGGRVARDLIDVELTSSESPTLSGTASLVLYGGEADLLVVAARTGDGSLALLAVDSAAPGVKAEPRPSIDRTRSLADVVFDEVAVNEGDIIQTGEAAEALLDSIVDVGMVALAADALGAADRALDMSVAYAKEREQFGRPIGTFQAIKHKLADMYVLAKGAEAAIEGAASALDENTIVARRRAAVAGLFCRTAAARIAGDAVQAHGGIGFTWEHDCHILLKRTKLDLLLLGDTWLQGERLVGQLMANA